MRLDRLLSEIEARGIELSMNGETLHVEAPRGVLTEELLADLRTMKKELITSLRAGEKRYPFPALMCSNWCARPVRWYGGLQMKAYCNQCWHRLGFYKWYMENSATLIVEAEEARSLPHKNGLGCPEWLTPGDPEWDKQVAKNGIGEMRERRAAWLREQEREEKAG